MPSWLIPILNALGPLILRWALNFLNSKYPGLGPIIKEIIQFIEREPDKNVAVDRVKETLHSSARLPEPVGLS